MLADYQAIIDDASARLPALFGRLPRARWWCERVPAFKEEGAARGYYELPPFDGSKPGIFYANLRHTAEHPKFGMRTLAYHEAIPGHHLQIALAQELQGVPFFRRVVPFTAFIEGWALYAERLAAESGFHPTPFDRLGQLVAEEFRAARLVVDTGIHAQRWTREQAIDYMLANTALEPTEVVAEVERYIVMPGQALAYKTGQLEILACRERARRELGDALRPARVPRRRARERRAAAHAALAQRRRLDRGAPRLVNGLRAAAPRSPGALLAAEREPAVQLLARAFRDNPLNVAVIGSRRSGAPAARERPRPALAAPDRARARLRAGAARGRRAGRGADRGPTGCAFRCRRLRSRGACAAASARACAWRGAGRTCSRRSRRCTRPSRTGT